MNTSEKPFSAAQMKSAEILERLRAESLSDFSALAALIASGHKGDLATLSLTDPWVLFAARVANVLSMSGKSLADLAQAVEKGVSGA